MSRFNTGNPLGSGDPRDLDDNAKNMDLAVNSDELSWSDRFGRDRKSFEGMEREFDADQDSRENKFDSAQTYRENEFDSAQYSREERFNDFISASGYQFLGDYAAGIEITEYNQVVRDVSGEFWRLSGTTVLPYTTNGAGLPEGGAFVSVGDAALRQELAAPGGAGLVGNGGIVFDSVADMVAADWLVPGMLVHVASRFAGWAATVDGPQGANTFRITSEVMPEDGGSVFALAGVSGSAVGTFPNGVNVHQFGANRDNDMVTPLKNALAYSDHVSILAGTYTFTGEIAIPSGKHIHMENPTINMFLDGENGRGFHFADGTSDSKITGTAKIVASATMLGSDGSRNGVFSWGPDFYVPLTPLGTYDCDLLMDWVDVESVGAANVKLVNINSLTERVRITNVLGSGQANFGFAAHWGARGDHGTLTDATWHPHNIVLENCHGGPGSSGNWLRTFTFSACGKVTLVDCGSESNTLAYNMFVGDYGYTYAQNIAKSEQYQFHLIRPSARGAGAVVTGDAQSAGLNGSPIWKGTEHSARIIIDDLELDGTLHPTGLVLAFTSVDRVQVTGKVHDSAPGKTREFLYPQGCNTVECKLEVLHSNRARIRNTRRAILHLDYSKPVPTPDTTTWAVVMEGVGHMEVYGKLRDTRIGVATSAVGNGYLKVAADFENIGLQCVQSTADYTDIPGGVCENAGTATTTVNKYLYQIESPVGFSVSGIRVLSSEARYIVYIAAAAANGSVHGNFFGDLNSVAPNSAAVFRDPAATNVYIDPNTNIISGDVPLLVYP